MDGLRTTFQDQRFANDMASSALADLGLGGLTRSDSVHVGDITSGPMGSFFVDMKVAHFSDPNDVRANLRLQLKPDGSFQGASVNVPPTPATPPSPAPTARGIRR